MGFTGMFSVETILKIIGFGVKVGANTANQKLEDFCLKIKLNMHQSESNWKRLEPDSQLGSMCFQPELLHNS